MKKENSPRRFLSSFAIAMALTSLSVPVIHYIVDVSRVLHPDYISKHDTMPNYRYLKAKYYLENADHYNGIIFGSSRIYQGFSIDKMNQLLGKSWYKMEFPAGDLKGI